MLLELIGPIFAAAAAFGLAEWRRKYVDAKRAGQREAEEELLAKEFESFKEKTESALEKRLTSEVAFAGLANEFHEFKTDIKRAIEKLFERLDKLATEGGYACKQTAVIATMQTQISANKERIETLERSVRYHHENAHQHLTIGKLGQGPSVN